jgi:PPK2 family polyphosphate:nucleotide phosphotransferase
MSTLPPPPPQSALVVTGEGPIRLADISPDPPKGIAHAAIKPVTDEYEKELANLDDLLFFAREHSVLVILQGLDTSGKDGAIRKILDHCDAQGVRVESFKVPNEVERAHDFLWRVHAKTPALGEIVLFNRSHYEDVVVTRVHGLFPPEVIEPRYALINDFERLLTSNRTIILKFFLHISKEEQKHRLLEREEDVEKAWKLSVGDWKERHHWDDYQQAYELAITRCASPAAPWHIVPANAKWYRNHLILKSIVEALRPYQDEWLKSLSALGKKRVEELRAFRATI